MVNRKPVHRIPLTRRFADTLAGIGDRLFASPDETARARDWQIIVTHRGLGRRYRDPRIALLARARSHSPAPALRADVAWGDADFGCARVERAYDRVGLARDDVELACTSVERACDDVVPLKADQ